MLVMTSCMFWWLTLSNLWTRLVGPFLIVHLDGSGCLTGFVGVALLIMLKLDSGLSLLLVWRSPGVGMGVFLRYRRFM